MGSESNAVLHDGATRTHGKALLETSFLLFRGGGVRRKVDFASLTAVEGRGRRLQLTDGEGTITLEVEGAETWAQKIRNPRSLLDKLGVKPGMRVAVLGVDDDAFTAQLVERVSDVARSRPRKDTDLIFYGAESVAALARLDALRGQLKPNGAIWVVHRKGKAATLKDVQVFAAAKAAGLVDNKVASFSATHTAERLVIPLALRPRVSRG